PAPPVAPGPGTPVAVLTGTYGARVLRPLLDRAGRPDVRVVAVANRYFGGNVGVAGLMVGEDLARVLASEPDGHRYLLPDVCLTQGVFLDGARPADLPRPVEVVPTGGAALREALGLAPAPTPRSPAVPGSVVPVRPAVAAPLRSPRAGVAVAPPAEGGTT
ncbi:MAG TPA: DUF512 domain-containing protein, partial [Acidimicrobiales bacterium]|nr:DUF512 domain-containing protein [Acidimicrobiales bacterium]